ncbi:MAG: ImmA/IrrE family metallo-endopeptidase [Candidatus Hydrothermae bacterium]|nr:ImmA/IrrE family metallo-endopeptidase [Candidatus Hydrothermae bacterium]
MNMGNKNEREFNNFNLKIGEMIRKERERAGLSQKELAELAGFKNYQTLWAIEKGRREVKLNELSRIARALGLNVSNFLKLEERTWPKFLWFSGREKDTTKLRRLENRVYQVLQNFKYLAGIAQISWFNQDFSALQRMRSSYGDENRFVTDLARKIRDEWNLGRYPARNLYDVLEARGILIFGIQDAVANASVIDDITNALVLYKKEAPTDVIVNTAKALFRIIAGDIYDFTNRKDVEKLEKSFVAELLIPEETLRETLSREVQHYFKKELYTESLKFGVPESLFYEKIRNLKDFKHLAGGFEHAFNTVRDSNLPSAYLKSWENLKRFHLREFPLQYVKLAWWAYKEGKISKMLLAEFFWKNIAEIEYFLEEHYGDVLDF